MRPVPAIASQLEALPGACPPIELPPPPCPVRRLRLDLPHAHLPAGSHAMKSPSLDAAAAASLGDDAASNRVAAPAAMPVATSDGSGSASILAGVSAGCSWDVPSAWAEAAAANAERQRVEAEAWLAEERARAATAPPLFYGKYSRYFSEEYDQPYYHCCDTARS